MDSKRPKPCNCRIPTPFELHSQPRPITKLCCQSSTHRAVFSIASAPNLLNCRATKPPRVRYCPARNSFTIKRRFRSKDLSWPNDKFSRHAARKPMIARYRRMPRGRPAMPSWNLAATELLRHRFWAAELLTCGPQQLRYCESATNFELCAPTRQLGDCQQPKRRILPKVLDCATTTELLQLHNTTFELQSF